MTKPNAAKIIDKELENIQIKVEVKNKVGGEASSYNTKRS